MTNDSGRLNRPSQAEPVARLGPSGFDPAREKSAFMAGWLTRNNRPDVQPEEAWLTYLDSFEGERKCR